MDRRTKTWLQSEETLIEEESLLQELKEKLLASDIPASLIRGVGAEFDALFILFRLDGKEEISLAVITHHDQLRISLRASLLFPDNINRIQLTDIYNVDPRFSFDYNVLDLRVYLFYCALLKYGSFSWVEFKEGWDPEIRSISLARLSS